MKKVRANGSKMKDCSLSKCEETEWVRGSWLLSALWGRSDLFPRWDLNFRYTCSRVVVLSKCKLCYIHCATYTRRPQCAAVCSEAAVCSCMLRVLSMHSNINTKICCAPTFWLLLYMTIPTTPAHGKHNMRDIQSRECGLSCEGGPS